MKSASNEMDNAYLEHCYLVQKLISKEAVLEAGTRSSAHYPVIYLAPAY